MKKIIKGNKMATSSFGKNFVITDKKVAKEFLEKLESGYQSPRPEHIKIKIASRESLVGKIKPRNIPPVDSEDQI
jgi:hypothetical protein